jgi:hypothetical protein
MKYDLFELAVALPRAGTSHTIKIPEYGHKGLTFVEGRRGQPFVLNLRNNSAQRVLAVVSIDGLNVVDGEACTPQSRGYIIPGYSSVDIQGWRTSLEEVHHFKFEAKEQSYAKTSGGDAQNCGILSAKFFSEVWKFPPPPTVIREEHHHHHDHYPVPMPIPTYPWPWRPYWDDAPYYKIWCSTSTSDLGAAGNTGATGPVGPAGCPVGPAGYGASVTYSAGDMSKCADTNSLSQSDVPDFKLGTGWGETKVDRVTEAAFERDKELCTLSIYYAEAADLEKVGIKLEKEIAVTPPASLVLPQAFPGFCKPPISQ